MPRALAVTTGVIALAALADDPRRELRPAERDRRLGHTLYVLSHVVITVVSYVAISEVTRGWLLINIWHNAQYLLFVWAHNAREFRVGVDPARPLLSRLSPVVLIGHMAVNFHHYLVDAVIWRSRRAAATG